MKSSDLRAFIEPAQLFNVPCQEVMTNLTDDELEQFEDWQDEQQIWQQCYEQSN